MARRTVRPSKHRRRSIAAGTGIAIVVCLALPGEARSEAPPESAPHEVEKKSAYGERGTLEVGGAVSADWTPDLFVLDVGPSVGYFFYDRVEVSLLFDLIYENARDPGGARSGTTFASVLLEPSYHPQLTETVAFLGGLGVGYVRKSGNNLLELAPRVGVNLEVGRNGILTPALTVPIFFGDQEGTGSTQVKAGLLAELTVSVAW